MFFALFSPFRYGKRCFPVTDFFSKESYFPRVLYISKVTLQFWDTPGATTCLRKNRSCLVACTGTILYFLTKDDPRQPCVQNSTLWISLVFEISFFLRTLFALSRELRNPAVVVYHILARFNLNSLEWISKLNILDSTSEIFFWIPGSGLNHIQSFRPRKDHANHSLFLYPKVRAPVCHECT